ncbi:YheC/YheD family protein [Paenibacillus taiwanensis]|uniref:YheC/YheD family endospore coat-associated protein n=1 Tax=Paenibacillus taiwanensis TaxID=401638 RepID=UPI00041EAF46|nr:YheC/YheD family protein [Paenibacillus taiwanensis]
MKKRRTPLVVAVLTAADKRRSFKGDRRNFKDIINTGTSKGILTYIVTVEDLRLRQSRIWGYHYVKSSQKWERKKSPLPTVIYNRLPSRKVEKKAYVKKKLRACLTAGNIKLYNPFFFNKRRLFEGLKKGTLSRIQLPTTEPLTQSSFRQLLSEFDYLYLKPETGNSGKGIMTISYEPTHAQPYVVKIQNNVQTSAVRHSSKQEAWHTIRAQARNKAYIVQQGIPLATIKGRAFDLRLLVQKNKDGVWKVTGVGARIAGTKSITTHVPRGGKLGNPVALLRSLFGGKKASDVIKSAKQGALEVAACIEGNEKYSLGEMSLDVGVDVKGKLWLFEANARPMKFDEKKIRKLSLTRIFQYSSYLARVKKDKE